MIFDLRKLLRSGKTECDFFFEYEPEKDLISLPGAEIVLPVKVNGDIAVTEDGAAVVRGEVSFSVSGECTRCLKKTVNDYVFPFEEEVFKNNPDGYSIVNDKVNLAEIVDDVIATEFPINFLCSEDCKGICEGCGVNLNDEECKCEK